MEVKVFQNIGKIVENASLDEKFIQLQGLIGILLILSIMYKGYQTIAGRNQDYYLGCSKKNVYFNLCFKY